MLKLTDYNATDFTSGISIDEAQDVRVTYEINGARTLAFTYPKNEKSNYVRENKIVICEGQAYRVMRAVCERDGREFIRVECSHVWNADAPNFHIQNLPDMIGVSPTSVLGAAISGSRFSLFTDSELARLNMTRVDADGFLIDFFSIDKTNPYDVAKMLIESCGKGELYADNYKIALVERIGTDTNIRLDLTKNMRDLTVERDITDLITRLYPYGKNDAHIGSVNGGKQYIDSPNISAYGVREGYREYSDITEPADLITRAEWEFSDRNAERIDAPSLSVTGTYADISRLSGYGADEKIGIGDGVTVIDGTRPIALRVIKIEYDPTGGESTVISVGHVKKDLFFYLRQIGEITSRLKKVYRRTT